MYANYHATVLCVDMIHCVRGLRQAISCIRIVCLYIHHYFVSVTEYLLIYFLFYLTCAINRLIYSPGSLCLHHWRGKRQGPPKEDSATAHEGGPVNSVQFDGTEKQGIQ